VVSGSLTSRNWLPITSSSCTCFGRDSPSDSAVATLLPGCSTENSLAASSDSCGRGTPNFQNPADQAQFASEGPCGELPFTDLMSDAAGEADSAACFVSQSH